MFTFDDQSQEDQSVGKSSDYAMGSCDLSSPDTLSSFATSEDTNNKGDGSDSSLFHDGSQVSGSSFCSDAGGSTMSYENPCVFDPKECTSTHCNDDPDYLHRAEIQLLNIMMRFSIPNEAFGMLMTWARCALKDGFDFNNTRSYDATMTKLMSQCAARHVNVKREVVRVGSLPMQGVHVFPFLTNVK